ncbi:hypothetical protein C8039_15115 [Halogeometricum sp. wsp3]|nr:hypothetical protein C8039_15115 [Halogeometricum sp. wsp3]
MIINVTVVPKPHRTGDRAVERAERGRSRRPERRKTTDRLHYPVWSLRLRRSNGDGLRSGWEHLL